MPPLLEIANLSKNFGGVAAISALDLAVGQGEVLGLIGPNGAGKTTLFSLVTGFLRPSEGDIRFEGRSLVGLRPHRIVGRGITRTFQIPKPFGSMPLQNNIVVSMVSKAGQARRQDDSIQDRARRIMSTTGLEAKRDMLPGALTQGDLKKLEIARALATAPRLLLLDEPFAGLTGTEIAGISALIESLRDRGMTIVIVEHRLRELMRIVGRVVALNFGQKIADGSPEAISRDQAVIEAYLGTEG